jgi:hypothetical protein
MTLDIIYGIGKHMLVFRLTVAAPQRQAEDKRKAFLVDISICSCNNACKEGRKEGRKEEHSRAQDT